METTGLNAPQTTPTPPIGIETPDRARRAPADPAQTEVVHLSASQALDWDQIDGETTIRWEDWVEMDTNARRPVFMGTRIPVELVIERLAWGYTEAALLASHPRLRPEHIRAALAYAAESIRLYTQALFAGRA